MIGKAAETRLAGTGPTNRQHSHPPALLCVHSDACAMSPIRSDVLFPNPDSRFHNPGLPA
ncbi:hypothetical protein DB811_11830 [Xanthomonas perforans]|uniref:Uncharacterized protein n=1 Tax=Xanthomonas perforans TaxID=442694 RepID=A0AAQ1C128_XANPE|nr:hypothetical protein BJD13_21430 [Xanthomonas perforans]AQS77736.1 hypothetical protein XPE_17055 [Xanthomonas perforans 91-118]PWH28881.1 hypothetical protein CEX93_02850 [Xanthomonas euvesicatoria]PWH24729.1 hypothetical protein CDO09_06145 [Xanthomonas perforans]RXD32920.1 hypothetical protein DB854_23655 [Xanthomonas perforans]